MTEAKIKTTAYRIEAFERLDLNTENRDQPTGEFRVNRMAVRMSDRVRDEKISALNQALRPYGRLTAPTSSSFKK